MNSSRSSGGGGGGAFLAESAMHGSSEDEEAQAKPLHEEAEERLAHPSFIEAVGPYRMCVLWSPLPFLRYLPVDPPPFLSKDSVTSCLLSWVCPWIGHLGMATSTGLIHDFAGPFHINVRSSHE